jgi:hypothetical protein
MLDVIRRHSPVMVVDAAPQLPAMVSVDALLVSLQGSSMHSVRQEAPIVLAAASRTHAQ